MQQITILGNVGRDAVIRDTNGRRAIGFSVAVNESYKDAQGNKVESVNWYTCTIWREAQQSSRIADYLKAGQQVLVQGQPKARAYQSQRDGKWYADLEVRVDKLELVGGKKEPIATSNSTDTRTASVTDTRTASVTDTRTDIRDGSRPDNSPVRVSEQAQVLGAHRDVRSTEPNTVAQAEDNFDLPF